MTQTAALVETDTGLITEGNQGDIASELSTAKQWTLVRRAFLKHRLAVVGLIVTLLFYLVAAFCEFLAPFLTTTFNPDYAYAPPQRIHVIDTSGPGVEWGLYVNGFRVHRDPETLADTFTVDPSKKIPLELFHRGESYEMWGFIPMDIHLIGPVDNKGPMYLLGSDKNGRDLLSRLIYATRVSMSIGLIGVVIALVLGLLLGGLSGYFGGRVDTFIQRLVEFFMSIPTLPLWLGLAAAVPDNWGALPRYFAITIILALLGWTSLARVTRGRFLALRGEDFVTAAELDGNRQGSVIFRHMLPSMTSYLIAHLTLAVPQMILSETSLSFLGLGLQPPVVSWGVLLEDAQQVRVIATAPWLLVPGLAVVVVVLALNFVGDGLRDAADPYNR